MIKEVQDLSHNIAKYLSHNYASALFGLLLLVTILYYCMEYFCPNKYDTFFMLTGQTIGSVLFALVIIVLIAFILVLFRKVNK
jgi:MFS superfamily sulfate permease-like transporter